MFPFQTTPDRRAAQRDDLVPPPPLRFRGLEGKPRDAQIIHKLAFKQDTELTAAQRSGLRYEAKAQLWLNEVLLDYQVAPTLLFRDGANWRSVVPDGLVVHPEVCFVFEIKIQHMPESWWQLRKLYVPILESVCANVIPVEVCKTYDPSITYPEPIRLVAAKSLESVVRAPPQIRGTTIVVVWRP